MGITTSDGGAGLGDALLGADHVDDALLAGLEVKISDAEVIAVFANRIDHIGGEGISRLVLVDRGDDVVDGREGPGRVFYGDTEIAKHSKCLRAGDLVDEVSSDEELRSSVAQCAHGVSIPNFLIKCLSHGMNPVFFDGGEKVNRFLVESKCGRAFRLKVRHLQLR